MCDACYLQSLSPTFETRSQVHRDIVPAARRSDAIVTLIEAGACSGMFGFAVGERKMEAQRRASNERPRH